MTTFKQTKSDWQNALPASQSTAALATAAASLWRKNPVNSLTLPEHLDLADKDNDGKIDKEEFEQLIKLAGAQGLKFEMVDADGDGNLSAEEIQKLQDLNRGKVKARNSV